MPYTTAFAQDGSLCPCTELSTLNTNVGKFIVVVGNRGDSAVKVNSVKYMLFYSVWQSPWNDCVIYTHVCYYSLPKRFYAWNTPKFACCTGELTYFGRQIFSSYPQQFDTSTKLWKCGLMCMSLLQSFLINSERFMVPCYVYQSVVINLTARGNHLINFCKNPVC